MAEGGKTVPGDQNGNGAPPQRVQLRPLTVKDLQLISRAAKDSDTLVAALMVQRSLVEPAMEVAQVSVMHAGLLQFLLDEVYRISGLSATPDGLSEAARDPLARAAFVLAKEFGWTPEEVNDLTLGQVLLQMQMLKENLPS